MARLLRDTHIGTHVTLSVRFSPTRITTTSSNSRQFHTFRRAMSVPTASTPSLDEGMSAEEMWELVKLLNRELKTMKSGFEVLQLVSGAWYKSLDHK